MTNLFSQDEIYKLMRRKGDFGRQQAIVGSAICMCESPDPKGTETADADRVGDQDLANEKWGYSYGLGQVRSLREHKATGLWRDEDRLLDPVFNVQSMLKIRRDAGNWRPWTCFTNKQYQAYLPELFPPPPHTYIVKSGDTLSQIAERELEGRHTWQEWALANNLHEPYMLYINQALVHPALFPKIGGGAPDADQGPANRPTGIYTESD